MNNVSGVATAGSRGQSGMALATSLIFLLVLTIIGVTALQTSSLEEGMARNLQELVRSFGNAETGVTRALADDDAFSTNDQHDNNVTRETLLHGEVEYTRRYLGDTPPKRGINTAQGTGTQYLHFEVKSRGTTATRARTVIDQGGYFEAPNPSGVLVQN